MKIRSFPPHAATGAYISDILVMESEHRFTETVIPLIARGHPSIVFQLTEGDLLEPGKRREQLVLYGQNTLPFEFPVARQVVMIAFFLQPFALKRLLGFDAGELTDRWIDLSLTEPARQMSLKEQLLNAPSLDARLDLLNRYIYTLADRSKDIPEPIAYAVKQLQQSKGGMPLTALQQELFVTERTLQRLFEQHVGISPRMYGRICRFQSALQQLSHNGFTDMAAVAYDLGYADQSHLIRSFKAFTRVAPLEYFRLALDFPG